MSGAPSPSAEQSSGELKDEVLTEGQPIYKVFKPPNVTSAALARECVCDGQTSSLQGQWHVCVPADLPDEYFSPTAADLKAAQQTLSARTQALVNAPLQVRAVREAKEKARVDRWPNVSHTYEPCLYGLITCTRRLYGWDLRTALNWNVSFLPRTRSDPYMLSWEVVWGKTCSQSSLFFVCSSFFFLSFSLTSIRSITPETRFEGFRP